MGILDLSNLNLSEKEQKILESSIKIFCEKGFSAATTSEIAKSAGIAEGTIFRYFKTKKDILRGILVHTINIASGKLVLGSVEKILLDSGDKDLRMILKELLYDRINIIDTLFPMARVIFTEALFHEDVREALYENIVVKALALIKEFHVHTSHQGMIRKDLEPEIILKSVMGNLIALMIQRKLFGDKFDIHDIDKEIDKIIDIIMYGIAGDRSTSNSS